jgi:hypothetical protein
MRFDAVGFGGLDEGIQVVALATAPWTVSLKSQPFLRIAFSQRLLSMGTSPWERNTMRAPRTVKSLRTSR